MYEPLVSSSYFNFPTCDSIFSKNTLKMFPKTFSWTSKNVEMPEQQSKYEKMYNFEKILMLKVLHTYANIYNKTLYTYLEKNLIDNKQE